MKQKRPLRGKHSKCPWVLLNLFTNECWLHRERTDRESLQTTKPKNFSKWRASQKKKSLFPNQFIDETHIYTISTALGRGHSRIPAAAGNPEDSNCRVDGPARNTHSWPVLPIRLAESGIWGLCLAVIAKENQQTGISKGRWIYLQFWPELGREKILSFFSLLLLVVVTFYRKMKQNLRSM